MANDSTTAGPLLPVSAPPPSDETLEDLLQAHVVGVTGLDGSLVRPRWQPNPPNQPEPSTDWIALGVSVGKPDWDAFQSHDPELTQSSVQRSQMIEVLYSFYGPRSQELLELFVDAMSVTQNRQPLDSQGIKFVGFADPANVPALLKERWVRRVDLKATFRRWTSRTYQIRNLASATAVLDNERYLTDISVSPPSP